jgi:putative ABC transport system permease protein
METFGSQGYVSLHLDISPTVSTEKVELQVQRILHDQPNAEVVSFQNKKNEQQSLLSQQMFLIQALIFVVFLISGIGLMNAIVSSLHDRRREIAILQAIGITPGQLLQILALEGMYMGVGGGIIGAAGGGILAYFLLQAMEISQVAFPWETGGILLAVSILLGIFASLIATTQVKRLSLSEALKII